MEKLRSLVRSILEKGFLLSLATQDKGGVWASDVIYVHDDDFNIYWLSQVGTRHSKAILANPRVAGTITVSNNPGEKNVGLQIEGKAEKIEGDILEIGKRHRIKRGKLPPKKEGEILEPGESWYRLKPAKIEITYEPLFGFTKKVLAVK